MLKNMDETEDYRETVNGVNPPPEIVLAAAAHPVNGDYETWRVVVYEQDGSYYFYQGVNGQDYKIKRNATAAAERYNGAFGRNGRSWAFVKRVRITECQEDET